MRLMGLLKTTALFVYNFAASDKFNFGPNFDFDLSKAATTLFKSTNFSNFFFLHDLERRLNKF